MENPKDIKSTVPKVGVSTQKGVAKNIRGVANQAREKKYYKMKYFGAPAPKPLTVVDFCPCDLIVY